MRARIALLSSPIFIGLVAVLALNDHVLKESAPGVVTGKLSDFAGLFVVAVLLGVLTRSRVFAIVSTALGFVALKTVPAAAVVAAPLLGGRTRIDSSDLAALLVLAPAWWWLGRKQGVRRGELRVALGVLGGLVAMSTVTATSCALPDQVEHLVRAQNGSLIAKMRSDYQVRWAVSRDGRLWARTSAPSAPFLDRQSACLAAGTCFRVVVDERVESRVPNGPWRTAFAFNAEQRHRRSLRDRQRCTGSIPNFASLAIAGKGGRQHVVVVMGMDGVLWRDSNGRWQRRAVLSVEPTRLDGSTWLFSLTFTPFLVALLLGVALVVVRATKRRWSGALFGGIVAMLVLLPIIGGLEFLGIDYTVLGPVVLSLVVFALPASVVLARRFPSRPPALGIGGLPVAAWHPDPYGSDHERWWDGRTWSDWTRPRKRTKWFPSRSKGPVKSDRG